MPTYCKHDWIKRNRTLRKAFHTHDFKDHDLYVCRRCLRLRENNIETISKEKNNEAR